ncbi:helix-turn-helix domain-containing protein [Catenulispora rubra]|uniref:helix-turn-helix domain-containing protein n=1 Tax=Catenulispora rubra TaxID=280293 RepID=UPI0018925E78|nr:helix-turn-helix transcriptional regulator [Catenulispora rubra]
MQLRRATGSRRRLTEIQSELLVARRTAGLAQLTLSDWLGVASRTLRDWEKGYDSPSLRHLIGWAYALEFRLAAVDQLKTPELLPVMLEDGESLELHEMRRLTQLLRTKRRERKISQGDLALLLGVSRSSIQRWEDSEKFPQPIALIAWAGRLEYSVELNQATNVVDAPQLRPNGE